MTRLRRGLNLWLGDLVSGVPDTGVIAVRRTRIKTALAALAVVAGGSGAGGVDAVAAGLTVTTTATPAMARRTRRRKSAIQPWCPLVVLSSCTTTARAGACVLATVWFIHRLLHERAGFPPPRASAVQSRRLELAAACAMGVLSVV